MTLGPLFRLEMVRLARRGAHLRLRVAVCGLQLLGLLLCYLRSFPDIPSDTLLLHGTQLPFDRLADFAETFFLVFLAIQMAVVVLIAPVYAGGSITEEKERRTIDFLFTSHLTDWEIVAGKLAARVLFVLSVLAAGLPVLALTMLFGGVSGERLLAGFALTGMTAVSLSCLGVMFSSISDTLRQSLFWTFIVLLGLTLPGLCLGCVPGVSALSPVSATYYLLDGWLRSTDPTRIILMWYAGGHGIASFMFVAIAVAELRKSLTPLEPPESFAKPSDEPSPQLLEFHERWYDLAPLADDTDPLLWRERQFSAANGRVEGRVALGCGLAVVSAFVFAVMMLLCMGVFGQGWASLAGTAGGLVTVYLCVGVVLAAAMVGVRAAGSVTEERQRGSLDSLLMLPGDREEIVRAKSMAGLWAGRHIEYGAVVAIVAGIFLGRMSVLSMASAVICFAGYVYFACQLGLWLSVRCQNGSRSVAWLLIGLLATVTVPFLIGAGLNSMKVLPYWDRTVNPYCVPYGLWEIFSLRGEFWAWEFTDTVFFTSLPGAVYALAGYGLSRSTVGRFERYGKD